MHFPAVLMNIPNSKVCLKSRMIICLLTVTINYEAQRLKIALSSSCAKQFSLMSTSYFLFKQDSELLLVFGIRMMFHFS